MTHDQMMNTFLILMVCLFVFAIIRELICWYFKINKRVLLQESILKELKLSNKYASQAEIDRL